MIGGVRGPITTLMPKNPLARAVALVALLLAIAAAVFVYTPWGQSLWQGRAGVVTANLTGALLIESAADLLEAVDAGGTLIVSGLLASERDDVVKALAGPPSDAPCARIVWENEEDGWVGLAVKKT